jgi:hypothetical protein
MAKKTNDAETPYVVMATAFGHKDQQVSAVLDKDGADGMVERLKASMEDVDDDFKVFDNIKAVKYELETLNPHKEKNDPYDYSVLDELDKKIDKNK